jgi:serine/threonine protein phosphatase PrpC
MRPLSFDSVFAHSDRQLIVSVNRRTGSMTDDSPQQQQQAKRAKFGDGESPSSRSPVRANQLSLSSPRSLQSNVLSSFGQDAFFTISHSQLGCCVLGVADGVGGWRDNGVDSGEISRAMMKASRDIAIKQCAQAAAASHRSRRSARGSSSASTAATDFSLSPSDILTRAYALVKGTGEVEAGSTTACIVALTRRPETAPTNFDLLGELARYKDAHDAAAAAVAAAAAEAASAAAASANLVGSLGGAAAAMMVDLAAAVSMQSEQFVATVMGRDIYSDAPEAVAESNGSTSSANGEAMSDLQPSSSVTVSTPIDIPAAATASSSSSSRVADQSAEPAAVPSAPAPEVPLELVSTRVTADITAAEGAASVSEDENGVWLSAANLGDSGYLILRRTDASAGGAEGSGPYRIVTASDLQRAGRSVKQLAVIPPEYMHQQYCDDSPAEAMLDAHRLQENDLLVLASDGLWSADIVHAHTHARMHRHECSSLVNPFGSRTRASLPKS